MDSPPHQNGGGSWVFRSVLIVVMNRLSIAVTAGVCCALLGASGCRKKQAEEPPAKAPSVGEIAQKREAIDKEHLKTTGQLMREKRLLEAKLAKTAPDPSDRSSLQATYEADARWQEIQKELAEIAKKRTTYAGDVAKEVRDVVVLTESDSAMSNRVAQAALREAEAKQAAEQKK